MRPLQQLLQALIFNPLRHESADPEVWGLLAEADDVGDGAEDFLEADVGEGGSEEGDEGVDGGLWDDEGEVVEGHDEWFALLQGGEGMGMLVVRK